MTDYVLWPGVLEPERLHNAEMIRRLSSASSGRWDEMLQVLLDDRGLSPNQWSLNHGSWFSPLHNAARFDAPVEVVEELIRRGAWRSLRTRDNERPIDIARKLGHFHLFDALSVPDPSTQEMQKFARWDRYLAGLMWKHCWLAPAIAFRPIPTEVIALEPFPRLNFPYPGTFGVFSIRAKEDRLIVDVNNRMGDSCHTYEISDDGFVLVDIR